MEADSVLVPSFETVARKRARPPQDDSGVCFPLFRAGRLSFVVVLLRYFASRRSNTSDNGFTRPASASAIPRTIAVSSAVNRLFGLFFCIVTSTILARRFSLKHFRPKENVH